MVNEINNIDPLNYMLRANENRFSKKTAGKLRDKQRHTQTKKHIAGSSKISSSKVL